MFYMVHMIVNRPESVSDEKWQELRLAEMNYAQELMREGKFRHVWRVVGEVSNVSIFDVDTHAELHDILQNLPLFPYMDVTVTPLAEHPSGLPEMYAYAS